MLVIFTNSLIDCMIRFNLCPFRFEIKELKSFVPYYNTKFIPVSYRKKPSIIAIKVDLEYYNEQKSYL